MPSHILTLKQEEQIIIACKNDLKNFSKLYDAYIKEVYRYTYAILNNKHEAEDVVSQTFLNALENINKFEWRGISIKSWLLKISRNLIYQNYRKPTLEQLKEEKININDKEDIEENVLKEELKEKIKEQLPTLDEITREIVILRVWEDYKFTEISNIVKMEEGAVKKRFYRGVKKLKKLIESDYRKEKKLLTINFALTVAGINGIKNSIEFLPSSEFFRNLANQINNKIIFFNKSHMNTINSTMDNQAQSEIEDIVSSTTKSIKPLHLVVACTASVILIGSGLAGGYFLSQNKSEKTEETTETKKGCTYNNKEYQDGSTFDATDGCNECVCSDGNVTCTKIDCTQEDSNTNTDVTDSEDATNNNGVETQDSYAGWETYENTVVGYKLKHPSDYTVEYANSAFNPGEGPIDTEWNEKCIKIYKGNVSIYIGLNATEYKYCFRTGVGAYEIETTPISYNINNQTYSIDEWYEKTEQVDGTFGNIYGHIGLDTERSFALEYWGYPKEEFEEERATVTKILESIEW